MEKCFNFSLFASLGCWSSPLFNITNSLLKEDEWKNPQWPLLTILLNILLTKSPRFIYLDFSWAESDLVTMASFSSLIWDEFGLLTPEK